MSFVHIVELVIIHSSDIDKNFDVICRVALVDKLKNWNKENYYEMGKIFHLTMKCLLEIQENEKKEVFTNSWCPQVYRCGT